MTSENLWANLPASVKWERKWSPVRYPGGGGEGCGRSVASIKGWALWHCHQTLPIYVKTFFHPPPFVLSIVIYRDEGVWTQTFLKRGSFKWKIPRMSELKGEAAIRNINESGINETLSVLGRRAHLKAGTFVSASSLFSTLDRRVALRHQQSWDKFSVVNFQSSGRLHPTTDGKQLKSMVIVISGFVCLCVSRENEIKS